MAKSKKQKRTAQPEFDIDLESEIPQMTPDEAIAYINARANEGKATKRAVIKRASQSGNPFQLRRPFLIASLDTSINGGAPAGGITQIDGPPGSGKNALCHNLIAAAQYNYGEDTRVAWCPLETPLDKQHARLNNAVIPDSDYELDMENARREVEGKPPLNEEEIEFRTRSIGEFYMIDEGSSELRLGAVLDLIEQRVCQLIFVDSVTAAVAQARMDTPLEDNPQQSAQALMISEFMRLCWGRAYANWMNQTTLVVLSQVRANRNKVNAFSPETKAAGAYALRHGKLLDLTLKEGADIPAKGWPKTGKNITWTVEKAKAGSHEGYRGELVYDFEHGFDRYTDLYTTAKKLGVLVGSKGIYDVVDLNGEVLMEGLKGGKEGVDLIGALYQDRDLFQRIYIETLKKAGASCLHRR